MVNLDRRTFLQAVGGAAAATAVSAGATPAMARAASLPAYRKHGDIRDVEHVVILMQENRGFDHMLGTMRGVRGYGDPHPAILPTGKDIWHQPSPNGEILPYRPQVPNPGMEYLAGTPHGWKDSQQAFHVGWEDQWIEAKGQQTMYHFNRGDIPYHHALADAFTICDSYFCSFQGNTDPNRYYMWTGWTGNDGKGGGPVMYNDEAGYSWTTYPERLEAAGVSWKIYQDRGDGLDKEHYWGWTEDPFIGNYGDNSLLYFLQYQNSKPGDPLYEKARTGTDAKNGDDYFRILREDVRRGTLPQVSWVVGPEAWTEHSNWPVDMGAWYIDKVLDVLTSNPEVWAKTAFFVTYDENDGFFDHVVPPHVPYGPGLDTPGVPGYSTVDTKFEVYRGDKSPHGAYGLGARVPTWVVSPWSVGGYVCSEVFDHTSLLRFLELRFGVREPHITPWRRAVCGDMTAAFDWGRTTSAVPMLPSTDAFVPADRKRHDTIMPTPPEQQSVPVQEPGVRRARPLKYAMTTTGSADASSFHLSFRNDGRMAQYLQVRSVGTGTRVAPRSYTVGVGKTVTDRWAGRDYHLQVHGPNGYFREYAGSAATSTEVTLDRAWLASGRVQLTVDNGDSATTLTIVDNQTGTTSHRKVPAGKHTVVVLPTRRSNGWYDLTVTSSADATFRRSFAGHVESGKVSTSDPLLGRAHPAQS